MARHVGLDGIKDVHADVCPLSKNRGHCAVAVLGHDQVRVERLEFGVQLAIAFFEAVAPHAGRNEHPILCAVIVPGQNTIHTKGDQPLANGQGKGHAFVYEDFHIRFAQRHINQQFLHPH